MPDPDYILTSSLSPPAPVTLQSIDAKINANAQILNFLVQQNAAFSQTLGEIKMATSLPQATQPEPIVTLTATSTLTRPAQNTIREVKPTANMVTTLYPATGSGITETFDISALGGFTFAVALNASDSYDANNAGVAAAIAQLITNGAASFKLRDVAANTWHWE